MSSYRGRLYTPLSEVTPLLPTHGGDHDSKEARSAGATQTRMDQPGGEGDPLRSTWVGRSAWWLYSEFDRLAEWLGWSHLTFMVLTSLVFIFTLTFYTCLRSDEIGPPVLSFRQYLPAEEPPVGSMPPPDDIHNLWGAYSPYFPVEKYPHVPKGCTINQVNIIQRHGARFPTKGSDDRIRRALGKLQTQAHHPVVLDPTLDFLKTYRYDLGTNDLVAFGAFQSAEAGAETYERYHKLVRKGSGIPFVRASGSDRVIDSATNWTAGFADASNNIFNPRLTVILAEHLNDTLEDAMCPAAGNPEPQTRMWTEIFATPIARRLNALLAHSDPYHHRLDLSSTIDDHVKATDIQHQPLDATDIASLMPLCAFESVAMEKLSQFCRMFTREEFEQFEYLSDLEKYYNRGYGQPLGPVQGVGYINELLARLQGQPVRDNTQTNRTLNANPETFPLDRTIYADFSHDNLMVGVFSAMGLFKQKQHLDPTRMPARGDKSGKRWVTSRITPFSARMVVERMVCKGRAYPPPPPRHTGSGGFEDWPEDDDDDSDNDTDLTTIMKGKDNRRERRGKHTYVRILINDALQPLEFCGADEDGLCTLEAFVKSQTYARHDGDGDFEKCFEEGIHRDSS